MLRGQICFKRMHCLPRPHSLTHSLIPQQPPHTRLHTELPLLTGSLYSHAACSLPCHQRADRIASAMASRSPPPPPPPPSPSTTRTSRASIPSSSSSSSTSSQDSGSHHAFHAEFYAMLAPWQPELTALLSGGEPWADDSRTFIAQWDERIHALHGLIGT